MVKNNIHVNNSKHLNNYKNRIVFFKFYIIIFVYFAFLLIESHEESRSSFNLELYDRMNFTILMIWITLGILLFIITLFLLKMFICFIDGDNKNIKQRKTNFNKNISSIKNENFKIFVAPILSILMISSLICLVTIFRIIEFVFVTRLSIISIVCVELSIKYEKVHFKKRNVIINNPNILEKIFYFLFEKLQEE